MSALRKPGYYYVPFAYRLPDSESCSDEGDDGVGEKLLHLLRLFDVENVLLAVSRDDTSAIIGGNYLGPRRYRIVLECAKSVLELCYLRSLQSSPNLTIEKPTCQCRPTLELGRAEANTFPGQHGDLADECRQRDKEFPRGRVNPFGYDADAPTTVSSDVERNKRHHSRPVGVKQEPKLSSAQRAELKCMRTPHSDVDVVFRCVCALKEDGNHLWLWNRRTPQARVTSTLDWIDVRAALVDHQLHVKWKEVDPQFIDHQFLEDVAAFLIALDLGPRSAERLRAKSTIASRFFPWLWSCLAFNRRSLDQSTGQSRLLRIPKSTKIYKGAGDSDVQLAGQSLSRARHSPPTDVRDTSGQE